MRGRIRSGWRSAEGERNKGGDLSLKPELLQELERKKRKDQESKRRKGERSECETVGRWEGRKVRKTAVGSRQFAERARDQNE